MPRYSSVIKTLPLYNAYFSIKIASMVKYRSLACELTLSFQLMFLFLAATSMLRGVFSGLIDVR